MMDVILIIVICLILSAACFFLWKEKKKGNACVGCPHSCSCTKKSHCTD